MRQTGFAGQLGRWAAAGVVAGGMLLGSAMDAKADAGDTCYWKDNTSSTNWDADPGPWYNSTRSWDNHTPNYCGHNKLFFDNNNQLKTYNNFSGNGLAFWQVIYTNKSSGGATSAHTVYGSASTATIFYDYGGVNPKIENYTTAAHTLRFLIQIGAGKVLEVNPIGGDLSLSKVYAAGQTMNVYGTHKLTIDQWYAGTNSANASSTLWVSDAGRVVVTNWRGGISNTKQKQTIHVNNASGVVEVMHEDGRSDIEKKGPGTMIFGGNSGTAGADGGFYVAAGKLVISNYSAVGSTVMATNLAITNSATIVMKSPAQFRRVYLNTGTTVEMDVLSNTNAASLGVVPTSTTSTHAFNASYNGQTTTLKLKPTDGFNPAQDAAFIVYEGRNAPACMDKETKGLTVDTNALVEAGAYGPGFSVVERYNSAQNTSSTNKSAIWVIYTAIKPPTMVTVGAVNITSNAARLKGKMTAANGSTVTEYGIVWGTSVNPTTSDNKACVASSAPTANAEWYKDVTGFTAGQTYHYRSYAIYGSGNVAYGDDATFTTAPLLTLSTTFPFGTGSVTLDGAGGGGTGALTHTLVTTSGSAAGSISGNTLTVTACGTTSSTGTFTIQVARAAQGNYAAQSRDFVVTVTKGTQTLTVSPSSASIYMSDSTLALTATPGHGSPTISYEVTSGSTYASVTSGGVVSAVKAGGTATITVTAEETANYGSKTATCSVKVLAAVPSAATGVEVTARTPSSLTLGWTKWSNTGYSLAVASGSDSFTAPTDGTESSAYTGNAAYGSGTALGSGYVVYVGNGTPSVPVTGLSPATLYHFAVYSRAGSSGYYAFAPAATTSAWTLSTEPGSAPANPTVTGVSSRQFTVNWTAGSGAYTLVVVVPHGSAAVPVDGIGYTGNARFGNGSAVGDAGGYAVYAGSDASGSVTVTGLTPSRTGVTSSYDVYVYTYAKGSADATANYLTSSYGAKLDTEMEESAGPTLNVTGVDTNGFTVNWNNLGEGASYQVNVGKDSTFANNLWSPLEENFQSGWSTGTAGSSQLTPVFKNGIAYTWQTAKVTHDFNSSSSLRMVWLDSQYGYFQMETPMAGRVTKVTYTLRAASSDNWSSRTVQLIAVYPNGDLEVLKESYPDAAGDRAQTYTASVPLTPGVKLRWYLKGGSGALVDNIHVEMASSGHQSVVSGIEDATQYYAQVYKLPDGDATDIAVKTGILPGEVTQSTTTPATRTSVTFEWGAAGTGVTGYIVDATTANAEDWENVCTPNTGNVDAKTLWTNSFKEGKDWMYIGTTAGNPASGSSGSVTKAPLYSEAGADGQFLVGKAGLGIESKPFNVAGATNIVFSYTVYAWNLAQTGANREMGRVDAYYKLDSGPWNFLGTGVPPSTSDDSYTNQYFVLGPGQLDGGSVTFKIVAPNAAKAGNYLAGPYVQALKVVAHTGEGNYNSHVSATYPKTISGTGTLSETVEGLSANTTVHFRVQALQGAAVKSIWVEGDGSTGGFSGPTPSVEGTGRYEVTASWPAYDGEDAEDYNISYNVQLTGCSAGGDPTDAATCPASGRAWGSSTTDWTYQRAYSGSTESAYPKYESGWHKLWGQFSSTTVYPGLESPEMNLTGYVKGYVEFSHNYINQVTNSEVALYYKVGDGSWTKWAETPRASTQTAASAVKRNVQLPPEVMGQTRVKVKLVAFKAANYKVVGETTTNYYAQGASVFGVKVTAQGAGGGDYTCTYTSQVVNVTATNYVFETLALPTGSHALYAGSNYYVHVQYVLTPTGGGAATTSAWGEDGNGTTAAPQLPPPEIWAEDAKQQHLTLAWDAAEGADENTRYWVQLASSSCTPEAWTSTSVQPSSTNADLGDDDDWFYIGGGTEVAAVDGVKGAETSYITDRDVYPAWAKASENSIVLAGEGAPGIESVAFSTVGATNGTLTFGHGRWFAHRADAAAATVLSLYYSTDNGESWNAWANTTTTAVSYAYNNVTNFTLPSAALGKSSVKVRIVAEAGDIGFATNNATVKHARGAAVTAAKVTLKGARGNYDSCLMRSVQDLTHDQLSQVFGDLTNSTLYYFRVAASDGTQYGDWVDGAAWTLAPPATPTNAPWATAIGRHTMTIQWVAVEGAETYTLEVYTNSACTVRQAQFTGIEGTAQKVTGLKAQTTYWFKVRAHGDGTDSPGWSPVGSAKTVNTVAVTGLRAEQILDTSMVLKWDWVDGTTYTLHWGPVVTNGATASRVETIECPAKSLERSDAGNGWFYLGGNGDYPAYWTSSGNPTNDQGHALIYATGGKPAMQSRWFSTLGATNATVEFLHGRFNAGADSTILVQYSVDGGASWSQAGTADSTTATNPSVSRVILLPSAALGRRSVAVRLTASGASGNKGAHLKDVKVVVRSGSTGEGTAVNNSTLGSTGSYALSGLTAGTRYWFEMTASEAGDAATAETTAATRTKTTGVVKSQGFEGPSGNGALDTYAWTYTTNFYTVGQTSPKTWAAGDPVVEVVADENPLYGDRAIRMSGSTNASVYGVVEFANYSAGDGSALSVTVPFASRNLASGENLWFSYSVDGGITWKAPAAKTVVTNGWPMAKIGMGGSDAINQNWPYNHGSNTTTRPQGDAYVFETNGISQLKVRIAFCGNSRSANHYYYLDGVTLKRLPGTPTSATAEAQDDGSMKLTWTPPAGQSVVILRGRDERHVPQSPIDLDNLPSGYELVTMEGGSPYFPNGTTMFYDREVTSGWKYYYYFYGAMDNGDGTYSLSTQCATANDVVKGMVTAIASQGWDGWDVHPWGYRKGRVTNPGANSDGGWWKTNGNIYNPKTGYTNVLFYESWETDARNSAGPTGQHYADYYGTGAGATDADRTNQLGITSLTNYYGDHSFRLSGGGSYNWTAGGLHINTNNAAIEFANVDLSGYKNVQFSMHIAGDNLGLGGDDLHVAISTDGGATWEGVSSTNPAKWAVMPTSLDYGWEVIDGNHANNGQWDFYYENFEEVEYTYNNKTATSIATPEGNPYVLYVPDSVTQFMARVMFYDSNGGSKRKLSYYIDEVRLVGEVALETPHPTMENITSNSFTVAWEEIPGATTYDVRVTKCPATGDDAVKRTESFVLSVVTNGWTTNAAGGATMSTNFNRSGKGYGVCLGATGTELTSPEVGAARQVAFWARTVSANTNSKLLVQVSEDGTAWETLTNYTAAATATATAIGTNWVKKTVDLPHRQWSRVRFRMERTSAATGNFYLDDIDILGGGDYEGGCLVNTVTGVTGTSQGFTNGVGGVTILAGTNYFVEVKAHGTLAGNPTHSSWGETGDYTAGDFHATADGFEMVRLTWAAPGGGILVMAVPETNDYSDVTAPTNTSVGGINGKGVVITNMNAAMSGAGFEHVRPYGARTEDFDAKYVVYWKRGSYWEGRLETNVTLGTYVCAAAEAFAYTNGASMETKAVQPVFNTGKGWASAWEVTQVPWSGAWAGQEVQNGSQPYGLVATNKLWGAGGNMLVLYPTNNNTTASVKRVLSAPLSKNAEWWGMFTMKVTYSGDNKWAGMQLLNSSGQSKASIGKLWGGSGIGVEGSATYTSTQTIGDSGTKTIVFHWDKRKMWLKTFAGGSTFRPTDPAPAFDGSASLSMDDIHAIQLVAQNGSGVLYPVWFDEIRLGATWEDLVGKQTEPPLPVKTPQAWADGNELVRIAWQYDGGRTNAGVINPLATGVRIYAKEGVGEGEWTEIYKGSGTNATPAKDAWSRWDHVVLPGSTHQYRVEAYAGGKATNAVDAVNRDAPETTTVTMGVYGATEYLDTMSYTNNKAFESGIWKGGHGFGDDPSAWTLQGDNTGTWTNVNPETAQAAVHITNAVLGSRLAVGNVLQATLGDLQKAGIERQLGGDAWCGRAGEAFYVAYRMAYEWGNTAGRRAGMRITDTNLKYVEVGKGLGNDEGYKNRFGVTATADGSSYSTGWTSAADSMKGFGDAGNTNAFLVVAKIYWTAAGKADVRAVHYAIGDAANPARLPSEESDVVWTASYSNAVISNVRKLELIAQSESSGTIGRAYFDEIRFGTSWEDIIGATEPEDVWTGGLGVETADANKYYKGDFATWEIYSKPNGAKQSAWVTLCSNDTTFANASVQSNTTTWLRKEWQDDSYWKSVWQGLGLQFKGEGTWYGGGVIKGEVVTVKSWERPAAWGYRWNEYTVQALPPPTHTNNASLPPEVFTGDARLGLAWAPGRDSGRTFPEVMVVRFASGAAAWAPTDGEVYLKGQKVASNAGTVVYRGTNETTLVDKGLDVSTEYLYRFYTVNNSHYSTVAEATGSTSTNDPPIEVDGDPDDWKGVPSDVKNSSALNSGEWIWTDKVGDGRKDTDAAKNADITEFRIKVDATNAYFMVRLNTLTNASHPYIAVGITTNVNATTNYLTVTNADGENWIGDESSTFMGGNLFSPAGLHYADIQMGVHQVGNVWQIELFKKGGSSWYGPGGVGDVTWTVASSTNDACIEWRLERKDLGLGNTSGEVPARFTVASFANANGWNNDVVATANVSDGTSHAVDTIAIAPWGVNDKDLALTAWDEGIKNNNAEYWFDIWFGPSALHNAAPERPTLLSPANNATNVPASPTMTWEISKDLPENSAHQGFVVGYFVEVSTNSLFNGLEGTTENGPISCRVNLPGATNTSYRYITDSREYWWRVRARDNSGALSDASEWHYVVQGKTDNEGPVAKLLYVGTNVMAFLTNETYRTEQIVSGDATSVLDSELENGGHNFGFVLEWYDVNGVFATNWYRKWEDGDPAWPKGTGKNPYNPSQNYDPNEGDFAWNILAEHSDGTAFGRVNPNWDLIIIDRSATFDDPQPAAEVVNGVTNSFTNRVGLVVPTDNGGKEAVTNWYIDCGLDKVFQTNETICVGNDGQYVTNYVLNAFSIANYRTNLDIYLTVSAEDGCETGEYGPTQDYPAKMSDSEGDTGSWKGQNSPTIQLSGWCADQPNPSRNVTTNQLLHIHVRDNDTIPPMTSTAKWGDDARGDGDEKLLPSVAVATGTRTGGGAWDPTWANLDANGLKRLPTYDGQGKTLQWQLTDGDVAADGDYRGSDLKLNFFFNVYDAYLHSGMQVPTNLASGLDFVKTITESPLLKRTNWVDNTGMILGPAGSTWTNWAGYAVGISTNKRSGDSALHGEGTDPETVLAWTYDAVQTNLAALLGVADPLSAAAIGVDSEGEQRVAENALKLYAWDSDNNAPGDQEGAELEFGRLLFTDDDATAPTATLELKGTGTNFTHFGRVAEWTWGDGATADPRTNGLKGIVASNSASGWRSAPGAAKETTNTISWTWSSSDHTMYHQNLMGGTAYRSEGAKYVRFDMHGPTGSVWRADMAGFHNRVSALGPTMYTLTVQAPDNSITMPALTGTDLTEGWRMGATTGVRTTSLGGKSPTILLTNSAPQLTSPAISLKPYQSGTVTFTYGRMGAANDSRKLRLEWTKDNWNSVGGTVEYASTSLSDTAANKVYESVEFTVPMVANESSTIQFRWSVSNTTPTTGFALHDVKIKMLAGDDSEVELATVVVEKNLGDDGSYVNTTNEVTMGFGGKMVENGNGAWHIFRLYGYGATRMDDSAVSPSSDGTWGINNFYLHGTVAEPKHNEVTDHDLRMGAWTNALTAADGGMVGYDTARSGLWVTGGGTNVPSFTLRYPDGGEVITSTNVLRTAATAEFDTMEDDFTDGGDWATDAGAEVDTEAERLVLPGDGNRSGASRTLDLTVKADATGLTASGSLRVKAETAAGSGGVNGLEAVVEFLNGLGGTLDSETQTFTAVHAPRTWTLRPVETTLTGVEKVRLTVRQATAEGTTVWVDAATLEVAQWGETVSAEDTAAWAATVTNGMPAAKFTVGTPELTSLTNVTLTLSEDMSGTNRAYRIKERVNDWDKDRADDWLAGTAEERFELYDDDYMSPTNGSMFGGPLGVFLNGTILPTKQRTGSGTAQKWVITDQALTALGAEDPVLFSLSYYDYSGWRTKELSLGSAKLQTGGAASSPYTQVTAEGLADVPSATNAWQIGARTLYTTHEAAFDTVAGSTLTMTATVTDLDEDRANDALERVNQTVGQVEFFDQDVDAPEYGNQTTPYYGVMVATNVAADGSDLLLSGKSEWVLGGDLALHQDKPGEGQTLADTRAFTLYDGQLREVASGSKFAVTANLNDPRHHSENGRAVSGLQRGTEANGVRTNSLWGTSYETTNSYVAFETAPAGSEGTTALTNTVCNEEFSSGIGRTRNTMQAGHTSWTWDGFSWDEVGLLLPGGETRDLYLNVYAFDSDTNRPGDQMSSVLAGPKIVVRDDDTQGPTAPTDVSVGGKAVSAGEVTRRTAPWTNSLTGVKLAFTAAVDPAYSGKAGDIKTAGIARYHLAAEGAAIGTNAVTGTNVVLTVTTNASTGKLEANLGTVDMPQGWGTRKLYAVDADDDRPGDGMPGATANVPLAYDITLPTKIGVAAAARVSADPLTTEDPATQFDLTWPTKSDGAVVVGPDDPKDEAHYNAIPKTYKDAAESTVDVLSPWETYKVYYGEFDEEAVPDDDDPSSDETSYIYTNFVANGAYKTWKYVTATNVPTDPTAKSGAYSSLGTVSNETATQRIRLYDLDFDKHYAVVVVGVDTAGNEGPAGMWSWATNDTYKFAVTQGLMRVYADVTAAFPTNHNIQEGQRSAAALYWMAAGAKRDGTGGAVTKEYDLLYQDASGFNETNTAVWTKVGTVQSNWFTDAMGIENVGRTKLRFYRASYKDRWMTNAPGTGKWQRPQASEEVYAMNRVPLRDGDAVNLVALHGLPYTNTWRSLFGTDTNIWPAGASKTNSTRVELYAPLDGDDLMPDAVYWMAPTGDWIDPYDQIVTDNPLPDNLFARGFSIHLPPLTGDRTNFVESTTVVDGQTYHWMTWYPILQVPTNGPADASGFSVPVQWGQRRAAAYTMVALNLPVSTHVGNMNLLGTPENPKFQPGNGFNSGDIIYMFDNVNKKVRNDSLIYFDGTYNATDGKWDGSWKNSKGSDLVFRPGDVIVIMSFGSTSNPNVKAGESWTWEYRPSEFYNLPTRWMGWPAETQSGQ